MGWGEGGRREEGGGRVGEDLKQKRVKKLVIVTKFLFDDKFINTFETNIL